MRRSVSFWLAVGLWMARAGVSQEVGIRFSELDAGTKLTTQQRGFSDATIVEEYVGREGDHHVFEVGERLDDGSLKPISRSFYDAEGRMIYIMKGDKKSSYTPFSCSFVLGECEHELSYYNPLSKKFVERTETFKNRRDGEIFYLGVIQSDGEMFEVPYRLGPHNLRISNEYQNALGQDTGYSFVRLDVPE